MNIRFHLCVVLFEASEAFLKNLSKQHHEDQGTHQEVVDPGLNGSQSTVQSSV